MVGKPKNHNEEVELRHAPQRGLPDEVPIRVPRDAPPFVLQLEEVVMSHIYARPGLTIADICKAANLPNYVLSHMLYRTKGLSQLEQLANLYGLTIRLVRQEDAQPLPEWDRDARK